MGLRTALAEVGNEEKDLESDEHNEIDEAPLPVSKLSLAEINAMIEAHTQHGYRLARSFLNRWRVRMNPAEVNSVVGAALVEAGHRYDPNRGTTFKTFLFYHLRGMLVKEIKRLVDEQRVCSLVPDAGSGESLSYDQATSESWPMPVVESRNPENLMQRQQLSEVCWKACAQLDDLEKEVIHRYFIQDQPLNLIAEELGYCRCHISRVKSRALEILSRTLTPVTRAHLQGEYRPASQEMTTSGSLGKRKNYTGGRGRRKVEEKKAVAQKPLLSRAG